MRRNRGPTCGGIRSHYLWAAVLADLHRRAGHVELAGGYREKALAAAPTGKVRDVLRRRLLPTET